MVSNVHWIFECRRWANEVEGSVTGEVGKTVAYAGAFDNAWKIKEERMRARHDLDQMGCVRSKKWMATTLTEDGVVVGAKEFGRGDW